MIDGISQLQMRPRQLLLALPFLASSPFAPGNYSYSNAAAGRLTKVNYGNCSAVLHSTKAELGRDVHAVLERVRHGAEVVIEQDHRPVAIVKASPVEGRKISEVIAAGSTCTASHRTRPLRSRPRFERSGCGGAQASHHSRSDPEHSSNPRRRSDRDLRFHGCRTGAWIYRAVTAERAQQRRRFLDELKAHIPIHPVNETTAEIIARIGGEQAAK